MLDALVTKQDIFFDLLGGFLSIHGSSVLDNWVFGFGWIRWVSLLLPATSESNSFIKLSLKEIVGGGRGDTYTFLVYDFSRFHHNNFRDTISWRCIVKDDCITSCLMELQSFSLSKLQIDPITQYSGVFSTSCACTMQDVVWSSQAHADLCDPCPWDSQP